MRFSNHARERSTAMVISEDEILDIVADPEIDYAQHVYRGQRVPGNRRIARRGDVAVAYDKDSQVIITVLWSKPGAEQWDRTHDTERGMRRTRQ